MTQLEPQLLLADTSQGVVTQVSYRVAAKNSVAHAVNFVFDEEYGEPKTRAGLGLLGAQIVAENNNILGLYNFIDSAGGPNSQLIAAVNEAGDGSASVYYLNGSSWSSTLTGDTANLKVRFETFLDQVVRVNGTDNPKSWGGSGAWTTTGGALDIGNMPVGSLIKVYKDQVIVSGIVGRPDDFDISSVPNTAGTAISWTSGNRRIRVNPEDNSNITGFGEIGSLLLPFKRFALYRWNNRATEPDTIVENGCSSHESISAGGDLLFFFNERGIWVTQGGYPVRISRPVQRWLDGMAASFYTNVNGHCDGIYYYCSIGDVTLDDGSAYVNVVLRYSLGTKEWAVLSYANEFRVLAPYVSSSSVVIVGGDTTARVLQLNSGTTDNGVAISYEIETHDLDFGSRGILKEINERAMAYGVNPVDALVQVKADGEDWITLGHMGQSIENFIINQTISGHYFRIRVSGIHSTARMRLQGVELPYVTLLDYSD